MKKQTEQSINPWFILALGAAIALCLFTYAASLPVVVRVRGDAAGYLAIAFSFNSIGDAFSYAGNRTYGLPLFLYLIRSWGGVTNMAQWLAYVSYALMFIHMVASASFYRFYLRDRFQRAGLPGFAAPLAAAIIMAFPGLVTHTTTPLTDTFCVDLLMMAAALHAASRNSSRILALGQSTLCGLILGYAIMVRPSFWPALFVFFGVCFLEALLSFRKRRLLLLTTLFMAAGTLTVIVPALETGRTLYKTPCLQNPEFVKESSGACIQRGLYSVRVFWSFKIAKATLPGIKDPFLLATYGQETGVNSIGSLLKCLFAKPLASPFYFGKKTIALFDAPHLQPYAVDMTPAWFTTMQRVFETPAFCGFVAMMLLALSWPFLKDREDLVDLPWVALVTILLGTHMVMHIEGRYGFPAIPFSIVALFLGFAAARKAGRKMLLAWLGIMVVAAALFLYQVYCWDLVVPTGN